MLLEGFGSGCRQKIDQLWATAPFHPSARRASSEAGLLQPPQSLSSGLIADSRKAEPGKLAGADGSVQIELHKSENVPLHEDKAFLF